VFGMAFQRLSKSNATPFVINLYNEGFIERPIFSFWLNRNLKEKKNGGKLFLGGISIF
jgi:phytepsin